MIDTILSEQVNKIYDQLPFPYWAYKRWQNDESESQNEFETVGSSTAAIRARDEWNALGREIYDLHNIERHADIVSQILRGIKLSDFFIQQVIPAAAWFAGKSETMDDRIYDMLAYLRSRDVSVDFSTWRGAFIVRQEIGDFLRYFLDYPLILNTYEVEVFSLQAPLAMVINHHLSLEYTSPDSSLIGEIRNRVVAEGILEYPNR